MAKRPLIQALVSLSTNGYLRGFFTGSIFRGPTKSLCVPGLSCYSCPGALGACPLGALQAGLGGSVGLPFYALGWILLFGATFGRVVCGFFCPFGWIQELLGKIPTKKFRPPFVRRLEKLPFVFLFLFVFVLPILTRFFFVSIPAFCAYVCPAGLVTGGLPLILTNPSLRAVLGVLFGWKCLLSVFFLTGCLFIERFFCRICCPLGALYGLFHPLAIFSMTCDERTCISCKACSRVCPMEVRPYEDPNDRRCVRCLRCVHTCPTHALNLHMGKFVLTKEKESL